MCFHIKYSLDIAPLYSTSCYTTTVSVARGHLGRPQNIYFPKFFSPLRQFYMKVILRLSEHGDVIEMQTI